MDRDNDGDFRFSYAISVGEGTLLAYGTGSLDDGPPEELETQFDEYKDRFLLVVGPADGTGE